jgi:hypothetical protein
MTEPVKSSDTPQGDHPMSSQWTPEAICALGATTDLPTLGSIFGVSRWRAYQMAHTGEWQQVGIRTPLSGLDGRALRLGHAHNAARAVNAGHATRAEW